MVFPGRGQTVVDRSARESRIIKKTGGGIATRERLKSLRNGRAPVTVPSMIIPSSKEAADIRRYVPRRWAGGNREW